MAETTAISWTDHTWNPWRGCTKISPGCAHCYMYTAQFRMAQRTGKAAIWNPEIVQQTTTWPDPMRWQRRAAAAGKVERVFTCSWSDFFHEDADAWRSRAWEIIRQCPNLIFQILTKRPENIAARLPAHWLTGFRFLPLVLHDLLEETPVNLDELAVERTGWPNVWLGVSVENPRYLWRVDLLRAIPARVRFISAEPLLAHLPTLSLEGIHWLIVGGESGPGYRPMKLEWARELREKALAASVPFFFKQSAAPRTEMGTTLDGREWREFPDEEAG